MSTHVVSITDLTVDYRRGRRADRALHGVSLDITQGAVTAVIGESGSGKSTLAHAIVRLLPANGTITSGSIAFGGEDVVQATQRRLRSLRGREIGFVPQDPIASLNPTTTIGKQLAEAYSLAGSGLTGPEVDAQIARDLRDVGFPDPAELIGKYPHELSGGMRQRILVSIAFSQRPKLVIADEPTSALDVLVGKEVMRSIHDIRRRNDTTVLLITHDLALAAANADHVVVLSQGEVVEAGPLGEVFAEPGHAYTQELLSNSLRIKDGRALPIADLYRSRAAMSTVEEAATEPHPAPEVTENVVEVTEVSKRFGRTHSSGTDKLAVDSVSFGVRRGTTFALVGESGSGKTTLSRIILGLERPTGGRVTVLGEDVFGLSRARFREARRHMQVVYQSPFESLNPGMTLERIVAEPLEAYRVGDRKERARRVRELLDTVQLASSYADRRPTELSGGQRQRVAIARALALRPKLMVLDEPLSALDATIQFQVLDLLKKVQVEFDITYFLVTHDLSVVVDMADEIAVMQRGRIVEQGPTGRVVVDPGHDYTRALLSA